MLRVDNSNRIHDRMSADIIVSYDGTPNDDDALALGQALSAGGASLALAYVRHSREFDPKREELAQHDAERRLKSGVALLGDKATPTHVVFSASTDDGLGRLALSEGTSVIVFGSDYRTAPGRAEPGNTAERLLEGSPVAIAIAAAGFRTRMGQPIRSLAASTRGSDPDVAATTDALAATFGATVTTVDREPADLIVVGSQRGAPEGKIALPGATRGMLNSAGGSVLVLAAGRPLSL
jgi:nucleotide-binding universal stress UspA family protein